jgi:RimJ/RimL family protein N-acetyltransferase
MTQDKCTVEVLAGQHFELASTWLSAPETNKWLYSEWRGRGVDDRLVALVAANKRNKLFLVRADQNPIGLVGLGEINNIDHSASIWYLLGSKDRGCKGLTSQAVGLVMGLAFTELHVHTIYASIVEGNLASRRVLEKNGFAVVGTFRDGFFVNGVFKNRIVFDCIAPQQ